MKEKDGIVDCPEQQLILYVEKEDGSFGPIRTGSYLTKNYIDDYFEKRQKLEASLKEQISNGLISPISFYITMEDLTVSELASRVGISRRKVRKHIQPRSFEDIPLFLLRKYAEVFNVSISDLIGLWKG